MNVERFTQLFNLTSVVSLVFQIAATALIAVLSYVVSRAVRRRLMLYWAAGWSCYTIALAAIMFASRVGAVGPVLYFSYYFFEYAAVLLIFASCRYTATDEAPPRRLWWLLVPAGALAAYLVVAPTIFFGRLPRILPSSAWRGQLVFGAYGRRCADRTPGRAFASSPPVSCCFPSIICITCRRRFI